MSDAAPIKKIRIRKAPAIGTDAPVRSRPRKVSPSAEERKLAARARGAYNPSVIMEVGVPVAAINRLLQWVNNYVDKVIPNREHGIRRTNPASYAIMAEMIRHGARVAVVAAATSKAHTITDVQVAKAAGFLESPFLSTLQSRTFGNVNVNAAGLGGSSSDYDAERVLWAELDAKAKAKAKENAAKKAARLGVPVVDEEEEEEVVAAVKTPVTTSQIVPPALVDEL